ncbi:MAG TPA: hypothetical protein VFL27_02525 [Candidatus Dormibacteraeota bacterium]|nr:hypothetical protein [Candidatus Dormibacteraeota bacterium]
MPAALLARRDPDAWLESVLDRLDKWGLMLDSDPMLPSWPALAVDSPIDGSWWSHPEAHLIHSAGGRLFAHPDVLHVVLVSGKRTCVHRRLHESFIAVAVAGDDWKLAGLPPESRRMLESLRAAGRLFADDAGLPSPDVRRNGRLMRELERRLLCAGGDVHTARGAHAKFVMTWDEWLKERKLRAPRLSAATGRRRLDECLRRLNGLFGGHGTLPWWPRRPTTP